MIETFDTYTGQSKLFYILRGGIVLAILSFILLQYYPNYQVVFKVLTVCGIVAFVISITGTFYVKNGEMIVSDKSITINSIPFLLKDVSNIRLQDDDYLGSRKASNGTDNKIKITTNSDQVYNYRFVIKSKDSRDKLREILKKWNNEGCEVVIGYYYS